MYRRLLLICIFLISTVNLFAQSPTQTFGRFCADDFKMERYDKDPDAEAVMLYDIGSSYFLQSNDGYTLYFERRMKIKVLNKSGFKHTEFEIPFYIKGNVEEQVEELEGNTYNYENNAVRKTPLDMKSVFEQKINERWKVKKFAMPDVKEGSVIELKYKISSPYFFNFRSWAFQHKIPVVYSQYITKMIPFYEYTFLLQGANKFDSNLSYEDRGLESHFGSITYHDMIYEYVMKDIPAFKDEAFITSMDDYVIKLDFQLAAFHSPMGGNQQIMSTWPALINDMLDDDNFGGYQKKMQKKVKSIAEGMNLTSMSVSDKLKYVDQYVKSHCTWNGSESKFSSKSAGDFLTTKTGNSTDINLFYAALLNSLGIEAYPILISTRSNGKLKYNYPFLQFFDYALVGAIVDGQYILLDGTDPLSRFREIPTDCFNDKGLLIKKNKEAIEWISMSSNTESGVHFKIDLAPALDRDSVSGKFSVVSLGYDALGLRNEFLSDIKKLKNKLQLNNLTLLDSLKDTNLHDLDKPFELDFKANHSFDKIEDKILITPFCNLVINENPLKQNTRNYPIDMVYPKVRSFSTTIHIPSGYKVYDIPSTSNINTDDYKMQYQVRQVDDSTLTVVGIYEFKKDVYPPNSYFEMKKVFDRVIDKFNQKIVLVKM